MVSLSVSEQDSNMGCHGRIKGDIALKNRRTKAGTHVHAHSGTATHAINFTRQYNCRALDHIT
eukprot:365067-Chlamydomonas_euryale.AAC.14